MKILSTEQTSLRYWGAPSIPKTWFIFYDDGHFVIGREHETDKYGRSRIWILN